MDFVKSFFERFQRKEQPAWRRYWYLAAILVLFLLAFWLRTFPAKYGELQAIDPFYIYRISEYVVTHNFQLPELDMLRNYPIGINPAATDQPVMYYMPAVLYVLGGGWGMSYFNFGLLYPAALGALAVVVMFFLAKELFNSNKIGALAAFLLAVIPGFITRTSSGFFEKEPPAGVFSLLTVYFFVRAFKNKSWKEGVLSGLFLFLLLETWGGARYFVAVISLFCFVLLLVNRNFDNVLKAFLPMAIIGVGLTELLPLQIGFSSVSGIISLFVVGLVVLRYAAERYKLVEKKNLFYVVPVLVVISIVGLLVASMFSDQAYSLVEGVLQTAQFNPQVELSTVAESQPGSWAAIQGVSSTQFSTGLLPQLGFITPYTAVWLLALLGILVSAYAIYKHRDLLFLFPIIWALTAIWGVLGFIRLSFLIGPPFALLGAYFVCTLFTKGRQIEMRTDKYKFRLGSAKIGIIGLLLTIYIVLMLLTNFANGYVYANNLGPSICFPNKDILIDGQKCLEYSDGEYTLAEGQPWYQAMDFLKTQTPENANVLSWWDFGYWFQTRGQRHTVGDGGYGGNRYEIALWFTAPADNWTGMLPWLKDKYSVTHILMDYTLPGKYGAISKIATRGERIDGVLGFQASGAYPQGNKTVYEFKAGPYAIWLPMDNNNVAGAPMFLIQQNGQYVSRAYINDMCTADQGVVHQWNETTSMGGCLAITSHGVYFVPEEVKNTIFARLMFMNGHGLPVKNVFNNSLITIYEVGN